MEQQKTIQAEAMAAAVRDRYATKQTTPEAIAGLPAKDEKPQPEAIAGLPPRRAGAVNNK